MILRLCELGINSLGSWEVIKLGMGLGVSALSAISNDLLGNISVKTGHEDVFQFSVTLVRL